MWALPPARDDGLGAGAGRPRPAHRWSRRSRSRSAIGAAALGPLHGVIAFAIAAAAVAGAAAIARRRIGGYTGDVLGAFQQIGEIVMLLAATGLR